MSGITETYGFSTLKRCANQNVWIINNYSLCFEQNLKVLESPVFQNKLPLRTVWRLSLHPNFEGNNESVYLKLHLVENGNGVDFVVKFRFGILNDKQKEICSTKVFHERFRLNLAYGAAIPFRQKLKKGKRKSKNSKPYEADRLIVFCEFSTRDPENLFGNFEIPNCNFLNNLGNMLDNPEFSDITLSAGGIDFHVHKVILAARSPVFKAMLTNNMQEIQNGEVKITDVEPKILREMLHYMYTGQTFNLVDTATDLLAAANKYDLDLLKIICGKTLYTSISTEKAVEIYQLAEFYKVEELIAETQTYILDNIDRIMVSSSWNSLNYKNPSVTNKILTALISRKKNPSTHTVESSILNVPYLDSDVSEDFVSEVSEDFESD